ncbi:Peroxidase [Psidium guajava]|nr:Peroxidase [Psidium guajava]
MGPLNHANLDIDFDRHWNTSFGSLSSPFVITWGVVFIWRLLETQTREPAVHDDVVRGSHVRAEVLKNSKNHGTSDDDWWRWVGKSPGVSVLSLRSARPSLASPTKSGLIFSGELEPQARQIR